MTLDDFVGIASLVLLVVCSVGYWYTSNAIYIRRKLSKLLIKNKFKINGGKSNGKQVKRGRDRQILHCSR